MNKPQDLIGKITGKKSDKVRNKKSEYFGNPFYRLATQLENKPELKEILVFECWLENKSIYQQIEKAELKSLIDKRYLFKVQRKPGAGQFFRLINWETLKVDGKKN